MMRKMAILLFAAVFMTGCRVISEEPLLQGDESARVVVQNGETEAGGAQTEQPQAESPYKPFEMIFTGDVLLEGSVARYIDERDLTYPISEGLMNALFAADFVGVNLEMPFSLRGAPEENKQYVYRGNPEHAELLALTGVDYCSLANNHTLDYGVPALLDTMTLLDGLGIGYSGAGRNHEEASKPAAYELGGRKIAVLAVSRVMPRNEWRAGTDTAGQLSAYAHDDIVNAIIAADETADIIVVYVHWGVERALEPEDYQRELARAMIDAGADLIIGSHPHVLQGFEFIGGTLVAYSLGNFIFGGEKTPTAALKVSVDGDGAFTFSLIPCLITLSSTDFMPSDEHAALFEHLNAISTNAAIDVNGRIIP